MAKVQIPLHGLSPKLPCGQVADTNHKSRGRKPSWHVEMFATKSVTSPHKAICVALMEFSPLQCTGKVGNEVVGGNKVRRHISRKLATWFVPWTFMICVHDFPHGTSCKVGVMEFGLKQTEISAVLWAL